MRLVIANLVSPHLPVASAGAPLAWDNVLWQPGSRLRGVHQQMRLADAGAVLTYYRALAERVRPAANPCWRVRAEAWLDESSSHLGRAHAGLRSLTVAADVIRLG